MNKKQSYVIAPYRDVEGNYDMNNRSLRVKGISDEDKIPTPDGYVESSKEEPVFEKGEKGKMIKIGQLNQFLIKHKISYEWEKSYFTCQMTKDNRTFNVYFYVGDDGYFNLCDAEDEIILFDNQIKSFEAGMVANKILQSLKLRHGKESSKNR